ncbi:MAG TPA: glycosyltransferase family 4 protein, partial [Deltaproteobacteria bacterium]|nr:glycosyltransferase family 4 protein [Deltaproteobacteria bacterium]
VLYVENDLGVLPAWKKRLGFRLVGTAHQPDSWWRLMHRNPGVVSCLDALITVSSREAAYFEQYLPGRVHFIPHGIDTDFFRPGADLAGREPIRCVFSGKWLRDIGTLARVMDSVLKQKPEIRFEMIVPRDKRDDPGFYHLARYNQITWHADLSDEQLLKIYQQSSMLVLPMIDCTANNALLEAMACALPVVSTRIGGMPDYTDDAFAELLPGGDAEGMTRAVIRLSEDPQRRRSMGIAARAYAERHFRWDDVARKTGDMYREILTSETNHESGVHHP